MKKNNLAFLFACHIKEDHNDDLLDIILPCRLNIDNDFLNRKLKVFSGNDYQVSFIFENVLYNLLKDEMLMFQTSNSVITLKFLGQRNENTVQGDSFFKELTIINHILYRIKVSSTYIELPDTIYGISRYAFTDCLKHSTIRINSKCQYIDSNSFFLCKSISILLPSSIRKIHPDAFKNCTIKQIVFFGNKNQFETIFKNVLLPLNTKVIMKEDTNY